MSAGSARADITDQVLGVLVYSFEQLEKREGGENIDITAAISLVLRKIGYDKVSCIAGALITGQSISDELRGWNFKANNYGERLLGLWAAVKVAVSAIEGDKIPYEIRHRAAEVLEEEKRNGRDPLSDPTLF